MSNVVRYLQPSVTLTVSLSAYTALDVVGGLLEFNVAEIAPGGGWIQWARITDKDNQKEPFSLYLLNSEPASAIADADPFALTYANGAGYFHKIEFAAADYETFDSGGTPWAAAFVDNIDKSFSTSRNRLWGYLVPPSGATPDYANADALIVTLGVVSE